VSGLTSNPRVPMLTTEESHRRAKEEGPISLFADLSVFRILPRNPPVAREIAKTLTTLLFDGKVVLQATNQTLKQGSITPATGAAAGICPSLSQR
jgi:hypothetical protein